MAVVTGIQRATLGVAEVVLMLLTQRQALFRLPLTLSWLEAEAATLAMEVLHPFLVFQQSVETTEATTFLMVEVETTEVVGVAELTLVEPVGLDHTLEVLAV